ncbi:MAG: pyrroline-5-carboxylate reductase [Chitinophagales bacterium]
MIEKDQNQIFDLNRLKLGQVSNDFGDFIEEKDLIILAIKPQDAYSIYPQLKEYIKPKHIILSIMAGVSISEIKQELGTDRIIRCMPNLACQIGLGATGFMVDDSIPPKEIEFIRKLLETTGVSIQIYDEDRMNSVTAISGSGPAYVFYFMDAMIQKAIDLGFSYTEASKLVEQTFLGAVELYKVHNLSCKEWISRVSSKGGTTEAAFKIFNDTNLYDNIQNGVEAAYKKSNELSKAKAATK